jgi:hypothetical protein
MKKTRITDMTKAGYLRSESFFKLMKDLDSDCPILFVFMGTKGKVKRVVLRKWMKKEKDLEWPVIDDLLPKFPNPPSPFTKVEPKVIEEKEIPKPEAPVIQSMEDPDKRELKVGDRIEWEGDNGLTVSVVKEINEISNSVMVQTPGGLKGIPPDLIRNILI